MILLVQALRRAPERSKILSREAMYSGVRLGVSASDRGPNALDRNNDFDRYDAFDRYIIQAIPARCLFSERNATPRTPA